jgi:hypothetical protein
MSKITTADCKRFLVNEITKNPDIINRIDGQGSDILKQVSESNFVRTTKFKPTGKHDYATDTYKLWGSDSSMSAKDLSQVRVFHFDKNKLDYDTEFDYSRGFMILEDLQGNLILGDYCKEIYYYQLGDDDDNYVSVVSKSYWEQNGCLDDQHLGQHMMPPGFDEMCESMFEFDCDLDEARRLLNASGLIEKELFKD